MGRQTTGGASRGFSNAIEVIGPQRTLYIAGQVGTRSNGEIPEDVEAQCHLVWDKIEGLLHDRQMKLKDVVKTTVFLTSVDDVDCFRRVRAERLGENAPASTLVIIAQLIRPALKVEVEAIASKDLRDRSNDGS